MSVPLSKGQIPCTQDEIGKILVVRNDNIGDVLCTTPCFEALKRRFPQAKVAVLVNRIAEEIVSGNPWLDRVYVYDKAKHGRYRHPLIAWWHQAKVLWAIRREGFDLTIGVRSTFSVPQGWLVYASGAPLRIGVAPEGKKKRYAFFYNYHVQDIDQESHEVDRALSLLKPLNVSLSEKRLCLPVPLKNDNNAERFIREHGLASGLPIIIINYVSRKEENRWWAEDKYVELIARLQASSDMEIVLTHGPGDEQAIKRLLVRLSYHPPVFTMGLMDFAALVARSQVFVTLHGGPMHVAAAVGTPTVAIFDKTKTSVWRPWGDEHRVIKKGDHANLVEVDDVLKAVRGLLGQE